MSQRIRSFVALFAALAVLTVGAAPALALSDEGLAASEASTPIMLDALVMRPMGLVLTVIGIAVYAPTFAIVGVTRPTDLGKPFMLLIAQPFRYTFMDRLGSHPDHS